MNDMDVVALGQEDLQRIDLGATAHTEADMVETRGTLIKTLAMILPAPDANRGAPANAIKHGIAIEYDL
jgi:hypothetical protein